MSSEQLFINSKVFTANEAAPHATAFIVKDGKISWIGDRDHIPYFVNDVIDLEGKCVIPGMIDAHLHPIFLAGMKSNVLCTFPFTKSIKDIVRKVKERRECQAADEWIEGWGYDESKLTEGREPTRYDLDKAVTDTPVVIRRNCGHIISVNSKALEIAGVDKYTEDVPGGKIDRDENGVPTGVLRENARNLVLDYQKPKDQREYAKEIADLSDDLLRYGITGISELMAAHEPMDYLEMYEEAIEKGLKQRIVLYYEWDEFQKVKLTPNMTDNTKQAFIGGIKVFTDGSISGLTAWVDKPFLVGDHSYGISTSTKEILLAARDSAKEHQVQLTVHAMGEQAIRQVLETVGNSTPWMKNVPSIRIEHGTFLTSELIEIAAINGIAFAPQPIFLYAEIDMYLNNVGKERTYHSYPIKTLLKKNIPVAITSDAPATSWHDPVNPFTGIQSAVTRKAYNGKDTGQSERIDIETAVSLHTREAQRISNFPNVGQLIPGYEADFVVLEDNIFEVNENNITDITVAATYIAGKLVYKSENRDTDGNPN